jgi:hypothetical protein
MKNRQERWPKVLPQVRIEDRTYIIDLRLGEFRRADDPCIRVVFDSVDGQLLGEHANVQTCRACGVSVIVPGNLTEDELRCVRCFSRLTE